MSKKPFKADNWLIDSTRQKRALNREVTAARSAAPKLSDRRDQNKVLFGGVERDFSPSNFLIPGWTGEGLISKTAIDLKNLLSLLVNEAREKFPKNNWNKTQKKNIHLEFLSYISFIDGAATENSSQKNTSLKKESDFWLALRDKHSPHREILDSFIHSFCFRSVTIYIFKIRFIVLLSQEQGQCLMTSSLLNPNAYLNKSFRKGGSTELQAKSLQVNEYSWFLPSEKQKTAIFKISDKLTEISITELMKIFSGETPNPADGTKINFKDSDYSHSLSHKSFGLFLNDLMIYLPRWLRGRTIEQNANDERPPQVLNSHFAGDNITALSLSHWLAQENNLGQPWSEIICPEFVSPKYKNGQFLKYCHELQYLFFLIKVAKAHSRHPVKFISQIMRDRYHQGGADEFGQMSFFQNLKASKNEEIQNESLGFDEINHQRIVLNLVKMPKTNPHHFLVGQIQSHGKTLTADGHLYVFTNQKLFVPSQSERVKQLLEKYQVLANFSFEELKGKGEIGNHLYVLKKRSFSPSFSNHASWDAHKLQELKESCLSFRFNGHLTIFHKFSKLVEGFKEFLVTKDPSRTPIYQKELADNLTFEFYQDAIFEGKLLSSSSKDSTHITHPFFFKKLTKSSTSLGHFFQVETLNPNSQKSQQLPTELLGITFKTDQKFPFVLVVNHMDSNNIQLEIIKYESYPAKVETYGQAYHHYFGLSPKVPQININLFKEYFETNIGHQVIQLCLNGGPAKLKSKLKSLLVPRFFADITKLPPEQGLRLDFLNHQTQELLAIHPEKIQQSWPQTKHAIEDLVTEHTWQVLGHLSYFKSQVKSACELIGDHRLPMESQLTNKLIIQELLKLPTQAIIPHHDEVYLEFLNGQKKELELLLFDLRLTQNESANHELDHSAPIFTLELLDDSENVVVKLHGPKTLIKFIYFILKASKGAAILTLLRSLQVPSNSQLENVLENINTFQLSLADLLGEIDEVITQAFIQKISAQ